MESKIAYLLLLGVPHENWKFVKKEVFIIDLRKLILWSIITTFFLGIVYGCSNSSIAGNQGNQNMGIINGEKQHIYHKVLDIINEEMTGVVEYNSINLHTINEQFILVELVQNLVEDPLYLVDHTPTRFTGSRFILVDLQTENSEEILWEIDNIIDSVYVQSEQIIFSYTGTNIFNGYTVFPYQKVFHLSNRNWTEEKTFQGIKLNTRVGNYTNFMDLKSIEAIDSRSIAINFATNQQTILAGGVIYPNIQLGMIEDEFIIDMHNVYLTNEAIDSINSLTTDTVTIEAVRNKEYSDERDDQHLVYYLKLKDVQSYRCELDPEGKLIIIFN